MEKCINKEILFDFSNGELSKEEHDFVSKHVSQCDHCAALIVEIEDSKQLIHDSLNLITPTVSKIPKARATRNIREYNIRRILRLAAGICLIVSISTIAIITIFKNQKPVNDYEYSEYIPDMNDAWKNNTIVVTKYDNSGNPIHHQVITD